MIEVKTAPSWPVFRVQPHGGTSNFKQRKIKQSYDTPQIRNHIPDVSSLQNRTEVRELRTSLYNHPVGGGVKIRPRFIASLRINPCFAMMELRNGKNVRVISRKKLKKRPPLTRSDRKLDALPDRPENPPGRVWRI